MSEVIIKVLPKAGSYIQGSAEGRFLYPRFCRRQVLILNMIEEYHFGSITISGKIYDYDVELRWTGEVLKWQREEGHLIGGKDANGAITVSPDLIVIGTGESGLAEVAKEANEKILSEGIGLIVEKTGKAIITFNKEQKKGRKVIGLFHLTC